MADVPRNGPGERVADIARRLQRVEDKLDERIATVDMVIAMERGVRESLSSTERLFEAKLISQQVASQDIEKRTTRIEIAQSRFVFALLGAFLLLLVQFLIIAVTATGGKGP
jgi:hypothetical protein